MPPPRRSPRQPLGELALLQREVSRLIGRLAGAEPRPGLAPAGWLPSLDVYEARGLELVVVEVPGLAPESLRVSVRDGTLEVSGERRERRPAGTTACLCLERPQGRFARTLPLRSALDLKRASARLAGGLLTISIPLLRDRRSRETPIPVTRG
jgi:HSP20 family protein